MSKENKMYHSSSEPGFWTTLGLFEKNIRKKDGSTVERVTPIGIQESGGILVMNLSTFEGDISIPIDDIPGMSVVRGDSTNNPFERDGELLIEIHYYKIDKMEDKSRRIRPTGIKFGIMGGTEKRDSRRGSHRAMGESADYYLEGEDTQYNPREVNNNRAFPFWRIGVWGDPIEMAKEYLPKPPRKACLITFVTEYGLNTALSYAEAAFNHGFVGFDTAWLLKLLGVENSKSLEGRKIVFGTDEKGRFTRPLRLVD